MNLKYNEIKNTFSFKQDIQYIKEKEFQFKTPLELLLNLIFIKKKYIFIIAFTSIISLIIRIFLAKFNNFLIEFYTAEISIINLIITILILITFKFIKNINDQFSQYLLMNYGIQGYSTLYFNFIKLKKKLTGEVLNIIQDDIEKVINLPYSALNALFQFILILVLSTLLVFSVQLYKFFIITSIFTLLFFTFISASLIFKFNYKLMKEKDNRLEFNLTFASNNLIHNSRQKQINWIKRFLYVKIFIKWCVEITFILLFIIVFFLQQTKKSKDQLYYQLMLLGMLKVPFSSLFTQSYYLALALNSIKRIFESKFFNNEPFGNKNKQNLINSKKKQDVKNIQIQINQQIISNNLKAVQRGQIKIFKIVSFIRKNISFPFIVVLFFFLFISFYSKFQSLKITSSIINYHLNYYQTFIFILPLFAYSSLYFTIIVIFLRISQKIFKNINCFKIEGQQLNRVSGDLQTVDKYVSTSLYDFTISLFGIFASLVYSISLMKDLYLMIFVSFFWIFIIYLAIQLNRYFMKSRRQIKRQQCKLKSKIIQVFVKNNNVQENSFKSIYKQINLFWKKIYALKNLGILIENSYIFLLNLLIMLIQIICLIVCFVAQIEVQTIKLILVFLFQIDLSISVIFLSSITLQMGLVNFQRCLNFFQFKNLSLQQ